MSKFTRGIDPYTYLKLQIAEEFKLKTLPLEIIVLRNCLTETKVVVLHFLQAMLWQVSLQSIKSTQNRPKEKQMTKVIDCCGVTPDQKYCSYIQAMNMTWMMKMNMK